MEVIQGGGRNEGKREQMRLLAIAAKLDDGELYWIQVHAGKGYRVSRANWIADAGKFIDDDGYWIPLEKVFQVRKFEFSALPLIVTLAENYGTGN